MTAAPLTLVSFDLCPYVQRAAIVLAEKRVAFVRRDIDLADKPDWFMKLSPLGKVPLLLVGEDVLFESGPIVEYLDETRDPALHSPEPLTRARHRAWMEVGSAALSDLWAIETTPDQAAFDRAIAGLRVKLARVEAELADGPFFGGRDFAVVDAVWAPVFRYFDAFDTFVDLGVFEGLPKVMSWRRALAARPSVVNAVVPDHPARLIAFVTRQNGVLAAMLERRMAA
jgi:glutathione S-transferase